MARIDSLLSILRQQNANELRLGTDREPKMLAQGTPKKLSVPATPEDTLRDLLGDILTPEREQAMRAGGRFDAIYASPQGEFAVKLEARAGGGFDVVFTRGGAAKAADSSSSKPEPMPSERAIAAAVSMPLDRLVAMAAAMRASDVHLVDGAPAMVRVDGKLRRLSEAPIDVAAALALDRAREERVLAGHSMDVGKDIAGVGRVRVHAFRVAEGMACAVRLLPERAPSLAALHLPVAIDDLVDLPHGLVLVCGATGAGKSTTLAALAQEALRRRSIVLATLEDPIEHALEPGPASLVRRREVGRDVPDFASGLRDALREDPDVLLLGEMRDPETIGLALTAAETGHLVLSSLHSGSAASAIERIVDSYPPARESQIRVQLADSLKAVVVQRLLPRTRGGGRLPALEVLRVTHAVGALVREGKTAQIASALQSGKREGMIALERCLADRVNAGEVSVEDARAAANDPTSLAMYLGR